jgi:hypothetical protein
MLNDFLSRLSSRAVQNIGVDSGTSEIRPRLVSRFETASTVAAVPMEEAPEIEADVQVETRQKAPPRKLTRVAEQDQSEATPIQSIRDEPPPTARSVPVRMTRNQTTPLLDRDQNLVQPHHQQSLPGKDQEERGPAQPNGRAPVQIQDISQVFPRKSPPAPIDLPESPKFRKETGIDQQFVLPQGSHPIAPHSEMGEVIEPRSHHEPELAPQPHDVFIFIGPKNDKPDVGTPPVVSASHGKLVRERIEITRMESPARLAGVRTQIVPALPIPERKSQKVIPETEPQPPTIHVTIGRIEIKAATPGPSQKRGRSGSATMSLDEYLRRRQGSER